ncbi:MAG: hypothetical protein NW216_00320 [Hyphomicrobium sp.]|nr:hypothetical protein [Hyphomicrobium sp.]
MTNGHRRSRDRTIIGRLSAKSGRALSSARQNPLRLALVSAMGVGLGWLVLKSTLPYVFARSDPDIALALSPANPDALIARAEALRKRLLESALAAEKSPANPIAGLREAAGVTLEPTGRKPLTDDERAALSKEIADLARRALAEGPLNATAYRLLGEATTNRDETRKFMAAAVRLSKREATAAFWLLNDSFEQKNFAAALDYADILYRTRPELTSYVTAFLTGMAGLPEFRTHLLDELAKNPEWRPKLMADLPEALDDPQITLALLTGLRDRGTPPTEKELAAYLNRLVSTGRIDLAYDAWLRFLPPAEADQAGLVTNPGFDTPPRDHPFDWQIARGANALAEIVPRPEPGGGGALHVSFGSGRVRFPEVSQILMLPAGKYRLSGSYRGSIVARRGLVWQIACTRGAPKARALSETANIMGEAKNWQTFEMTFDVPPGNTCVGQKLRLFHDKRSASEELIRGEIWFDDFKIARE